MENEKINNLQDLILEFRGNKVMVDYDLAKLYGVELRMLNQAVKRNIERFPEDFMFQLTLDEWYLLRSQNVISKHNHGGRRYAPYVFTEQGVSMLSSVINSKRAIEVNINVMRAFVKLRHFISSQTGVNEQIIELRRLLMLHMENNEYKFEEYDDTIKQIALALNNLVEKPKETKKIGFYTD